MNWSEVYHILKASAIPNHFCLSENILHNMRNCYRQEVVRSCTIKNIMNNHLKTIAEVPFFNSGGNPINLGLWKKWTLKRGEEYA